MHITLVRGVPRVLLIEAPGTAGSRWARAGVRKIKVPVKSPNRSPMRNNRQRQVTDYGDLPFCCSAG
jgi:hypothetical protein